MDLSSKLANLSPFSKQGGHGDDEAGAKLAPTSVAGGGARPSDSSDPGVQLRISQALRSFIVKKGLTLDEDDDLQALIESSKIKVSTELTDRSHPLPEYFISSSHNTYLLAHQLYGTSSAVAYEIALSTGSRCVEIDAWDNEEDKAEPKITHGYTLVSHIPFRAACEAMRDVVDKEAAQAVKQPGFSAAPIFLSLENHCSAQGQLRLVQIMEEIWGDRLLSKAVRQKGHEEQDGSHQHVSLEELGSKIIVIVEYHLSSEPESSPDSSSDSEEDEKEKQARLAYQEKKKEAPPPLIIPELYAMGVYAQSVKPVDNSWFEDVDVESVPHHHLINISEAGLGAHLPVACDKIARHNSKHLMRVFPKGTRIQSGNLRPVPYWGIGAQICALNWQTFGASMQLNSALFSGSDGFVLKPTALRRGGDGKLGTGKTKKMKLYVAGASDIPIPEGREADDIKPYVTCSLIHPDDLEYTPPKRKTGHYKQHKLDVMHRGHLSPPTDPIWDETLEWEYEDNELVFLRILIKSDDKFATNPKLAASAVRLSYVTPGWTFVRMLDLRGQETMCSLLVKFEFEDV